ncbi:ComF family protein [Myroides marinus]|uniref:ComF family protein n=1 Tax=Myroides marinus TaxID=703342 RepID=UPI0025788CF6|nr:ComF family protein [Myroides marinus]
MIKDILNVLFPKNCLGCSNLLLQSEEILCLLCRDELPFSQEHLTVDNASMHKFYGKVPIEHASSLLLYSKGGMIQQLIHNLKYKNHPEVSFFLGNIYAHQLSHTNLLTDITSIIPVPLHKNKKKTRGYNQVDGFAKAISTYYNIEINNTLLIKTLKTSSQTTKNRFQRKGSKKEVFEVDQTQLTKEDNHFLLLDDILTTGNTLESCCKKLLQIPNTKITILCLARSI